jgi:hypothetical protein
MHGYSHALQLWDSVTFPERHAVTEWHLHPQRHPDAVSTGDA